MPQIQNGIIKYGLKATGAPKTTGSLTFINDGNSVTFPIAFNLLDLTTVINNIAKPNVHPSPPTAKVYKVSDEAICVAACPAATNSAFSDIADRKTGYVIGVRIQELIPNEKKKVSIKIIKTNPGKV